MHNDMLHPQRLCHIRSGSTGGLDQTTGEEFEYVWLLTDAWREKFAASEQVLKYYFYFVFSLSLRVAKSNGVLTYEGNVGL